MKTRELMIVTAVLLIFGNTVAAWAIAEQDCYTYLGLTAGASDTLPNGCSFNTFLGWGTGTKNNGGRSNTFVGDSAGVATTTGNDNVVVGDSAGAGNQTGSGNVFLGHFAGFAETNSNKLYIDNCFTGGNCTQPLIYGEFDNRKVKINGSLEVATGGVKFPDGTTQATAMAGSTTRGSSTDVFLGTGAGTNTTGASNTFIGNSSGSTITTGSGNAMIGYGAGMTSLGSDSMNTYIGTLTGWSGSGNVMIGYKAGFFETGSNKLYIDNCYTGGNCTQPLIYGEFDNRVVKINGQVIMTAVASPSDERLKKNIEPLTASLDKVMHLQGVSYEWKADENAGRGFGNGREIGFVAQKVEAVLPAIVYTDASGYKSLAYDKLVPVLVEAIKEQQATIKRLTEKLDKLDELEAKINRLENKETTAMK